MRYRVEGFAVCPSCQVSALAFALEDPARPSELLVKWYGTVDGECPTCRTMVVPLFVPHDPTSSGRLRTVETPRA